MPLRRFYCRACGIGAEELYGQDEAAPAVLPCPKCGGDLLQQPARIARTEGRWGDQMGRHGVNGFYDRGLGEVYYNNVQREKICKSQGKIPLEDFGEGWWERETEKQVEEKRRDEAMLETYLSNVRKYQGDTVRAMSETMPAHKCLAGDYD